MKKSFIYSSAFLATLALASCSSNEVIDGVDDTLASTGQVIEIAVENAGDGLESRSGRPLYSSEAAQEIDNVKVVVVNNDGTVAYQTSIANWMKSENVIEYNDASGHGRKIRIEIPTGNKISDGAHTIYAIGYSDKSIYKAGENSQELGTYLENIQSESSIKNLTLINSNTDDSKNQAEELFAGSVSFNVSNGKFSQGVTLHRQVAGIFTYVKDIPCFFKNNTSTETNKDVIGTKLQLVAVQTNQNLVLGSFYEKILGGNGQNNVLQNVVNGTKSNEGEQVIYTIDLSKWFTKLQDVNNDGLLDTYNYTYDSSTGTLKQGSSNWKNAIDQNQTNVKFQEGSVFGSSFIIPFQKGTTETFELRLVDDGLNELRSWSIALPDNDIIKNGTLTYWGDNGWKAAETSGSYSEDAKKYSVLRNHLYGVGKRNGGNKPGEPGTDPDVPESLNTKQDIMLQVNDNWEVIHKMEVE